MNKNFYDYNAEFIELMDSALNELSCDQFEQLKNNILETLKDYD